MMDRLAYPHRRSGLDHEWFRHEPTHQRAPVTWPQGKSVALWITVPVEFFPLDAPSQPLRPLGSFMRPYPDLWNYSSRDYGARIGIYRVIKVLDAVGIRATAAVNAGAAARYPRILDELKRRNWEFLANGVDMGHVHYGGLAEDDERKQIRHAQQILVETVGAPIKGWHSPGRSQSLNTLMLLAESGFEYVTDWANDDMPYWVATKAGTLCAMPLTYELSDRLLLVQHNLMVEDYVELVLRAFSSLAEEARRRGSGRLLSLSITPWIMGYPHRIAALERLLRQLTNSGAVWATTGSEIMDAFQKQSPGTA